ncbi:MAG: hypothetical protein HYY00_03945 [Chloroflexi bacterium]|nr:hypothetical protein [Chloroflexota bacterium]
MSDLKLRWLLDTGMPRITNGGLDVVHAEDIPRRPGPVGITEAARLGRTLVTCNQEFRGPWWLPLPHPGIVVLEETPTCGQALARNLEHLAFRLRRDGNHADIQGSRFVVKMDRAVLHIHDDGAEHDVETWKRPFIANGGGVITPRPAEASV